MSFLTWIVLGLIAGFIASKIVDIAPRYRSGRSWCGRRRMAVSVLRRERGYRLEPVQARGGCRWRGRRLDLVPRDSSHGLMGLLPLLSPGAVRGAHRVRAAPILQVFSFSLRAVRARRGKLRY